MESPETGARAELRLASVLEDHAIYELELRANAKIWSGNARVMSADGVLGIDLPADDASPMPEWIADWLRTLLRGAWRDQQASHWPKRVTRWRERPERR